MEDVLAKLNDTDWKQFFWDTDIYKVDIKIPRFTLKTENDLIPSIKKLGTPSIFDPDKAEFPRLCNYDKVYVSKLLQKAAIEVNEKGTEVAAVTVSGLHATSAGFERENKTAYFHCDTPFVYIIQERSSGAIFFIGTFIGE